MFSKMSKGVAETRKQRKQDGKGARDERFDIINHQGNADYKS